MGDAQEIVSKFLSREETYGQLLISIAEYEKRIERLKKENEDLAHSLDHLKSDINGLERPPNIKKQSMEADVITLAYFPLKLSKRLRNITKIW